MKWQVNPFLLYKYHTMLNGDVWVWYYQFQYESLYLTQTLLRMCNVWVNSYTKFLSTMLWCSHSDGNESPFLCILSETFCATQSDYWYQVSVSVIEVNWKSYDMNPFVFFPFFFYFYFLLSVRVHHLLFHEYFPNCPQSWVESFAI